MASDYASMLLQEQSNPNASLLQILLDDYESVDLIVAVEGPDDRVFYFDFLREYIGARKFLLCDCGGKSGVIGLKELVEALPWFDLAKMRYICDKDFDEYVGNKVDGVFYIEKYSIESYYCSLAYFTYIVDKFCKRTLSQAESRALHVEFERRLNDMIAKMRTISALMIEVRCAGIHPQFDETSVSDFFDLDADIPRPKPRRLSMISRIWRAGPVTVKMLQKRIRQISGHDHCRWLRGKYAMQIAKICFQRTFKCAAGDTKKKMPEGNFYSGEAFRYSRSFMQEIAGLKAYLV